jgi:fibronectin type III domain protein
MRHFSSRVGYTSAGLVLVLVAALLGFSGHGLPALGMQMLNGEAWLVNTVNRSVSLIDGYSGKVSSQVGLPEVSGNLHVVNTPGGAVVVGQGGRMVQVSNDEFSTSSPVASPIPGPTVGPASGQIVLVGGGSVTATTGQDVLYAIDPASGRIRQLDPSSPQLTPIGPTISAGESIATPVVAPDGSLYVSVPALGAVGHVTNGDFALIRGIGHPGDQLAVTLAGTQVVAADLSSGTVMPLGATGVSGPRVHVPGSPPADQLAGSDISDGLVSLVGVHAVDSVDVTSSTAPSATPLSPAFSATASAMQGQNVVLINSTRQQVVIVDTATHAVKWLTMPGKFPPDQITVRDRLVFVNASDGASALVINGSGAVRRVIKYTGPPPVHPKALKFPAPAQIRTPTPVTVNQPPQVVSQTPHRPGAPVQPTASPGNASATVSWGAAPANGAPITQYVVSWSGGQKPVSGSTLGTTINGLSNGTSYVFTVVAVNSVGQGPSASTSSVTPSSSVPDAPTNVIATAGQADGSVTLTWSAPDNGYHVANYAISEAGTGAQMLTGVTGTTATIGPSQNLAVGVPVQFQVTAVGTSNQSSAPSAPSAAVTPYDAPSAPVVQVSSYGQSGTSAVLSVSCDTTCQGGLPAQTYQVTLTPSGPTVAPVTAAAGGAATPVTLTGLTPNTSYTASVTVTDTQNATGSANTVALNMPGPPTVSNVQVSAGNGAAVNVTATVTDGGETTTCSVSVSGAGSASGSCTGTISVSVPMYNTNYSVTFTATNAAGPASANGGGKSGLKSLTADATDAFGTCTQYPHSKWCGADSGVEPSASFTTSLGPVAQGTVMTADCWTTGGTDYGNVSPYNQGSNIWIHVTNSPGPGYMSNLWFPSPGSVTAGLPQC